MWLGNDFTFFFFPVKLVVQVIVHFAMLMCVSLQLTSVKMFQFQFHTGFVAHSSKNMKFIRYICFYFMLLSSVPSEL